MGLLSLVRSALPTVGKFINKGLPTVGKFLKKNAGNLIAVGTNTALNHFGKSDWNDKTKKTFSVGADIAKAMLGEDSNITKQIQNMSDVAKGEAIKWNPVNIKDDLNKAALMLSLQPPTGYYNRNLGGTNFKRRIKRKRTRRIGSSDGVHKHRNIK